MKGVKVLGGHGRCVGQAGQQERWGGRAVKEGCGFVFRVWSNIRSGSECASSRNRVMCFAHSADLGLLEDEVTGEEG